MRVTNMFLISGAVSMLLLMGCGAPTKKVEEPKKAATVPTKVALGAHADLLKGLSDQINLERVEGKDTYMGYTSDRASSASPHACLIIYGPPELANHAFFSAAMPYTENPDPAKRPEFMQRNQKLLDAFISNIFKGSVPEELKKDLENAIKNPDTKIERDISGRNIKIKYDLTNRIEIDVR